MIRDHIAGLSEEVGIEIERTIFSALAHIKTLAENPVLTSPQASPEEKLVEMEKIQKFYELFEDITLLDRSGAVIRRQAGSRRLRCSSGSRVRRHG